MRVLFLDDDSERHKTFARLSVGHEVTHVSTANEAISALKSHHFDLASLHHDLGGRIFVDSNDEETGYAVVKELTALDPDFYPRAVIVHSYNPAGVERMLAHLGAHGISARAMPFGTWSLSQVS